MIVREPPPHLRGALRAAEAARDRAARIRRVEAPAPPASRPPARAGASAASGMRSSAEPLPGQMTAQLRFARTLAAAQQARAGLPEDEADLPLHLRLRDEEDTPGRPERWLSRLLKSLGARARPAPERLLLAGPHAAEGAGQLPPVAKTAPAGGGGPDAPAASAVLRLPPLGQGAGHDDAPLRALSDPGRERPDLAARAPERPAGARLGAGLQAAAEGRRETAPRAPARPWQVHDLAPRASPPLAWAPRWRSAWSGPAATAVPVRRAVRNLPALYQSGGLPATRLAAVLARPRRPGGDPRQDRAAPATAASRSRSRWLMLSGAVAAGFALGIVAYGSSSLGGARWGQTMWGLAAGWSEPAAPAVPDDTGAPPATDRSFAMASLPATGSRRDQRHEHRSAPTSSIDAAPPRSAALAEARAAGPASAGSERSAGDHASVADSGDPAGATDSRSNASAPSAADGGRATGATAPRPAPPPATGVDWQTLYAEGHRLQLAGNLVAAADAYQHAVALNPQHPSILYDLGYVLQMQGRIAAAIDHYRRAIEVQPDHGFAHYNLAYLLQSQGANAAALEHYPIAAAGLPDNPFVYYDWAWSLELSGDRAGAAALYRRAIALDPDHRAGIDARRRLAALGSARLE